MATMQQVFASYEERQRLLVSSTSPYVKGVAWVEGELYPLHEARIPILDQGFMHNDLTYDVHSVWDGRYFRIVRGTDPKHIANSIYMFIQPYVWVMEPEVQPVGGSAVVARTVRRVPRSMDPTVKNLQWGDLTRGLFELMDRGATYAFLTDGDTNLTEGSGFNVVLVKNSVVYVPQRGVLEGITRKSVIDVARMNGLEIRVELVPVQLAYEADEIFMCTTAGGIMPITSLDGNPVTNGQVGPITKKIWDGYWAIHYDDAFSFEI